MVDASEPIAEKIMDVEESSETGREAMNVNADDIVYRLPKGLIIGEAVKISDEQIAAKAVFWKNYLKEHNVKKVVAPMVDQSELAFRMLLRRHGADLTYTPMIHAHLFVNDLTYRKNSLTMCKADRPLIVQFCANKVDTFLEACRLVEGYCDGVDLNLGCPQMVAKRGHYGSYLQDELDLVCSMVSAVRDYCTLPVSCKIRIKDCPEKTLEYATRLVEAGASMLTVHGRTRDMRGPDTGIADWSRIRQVVEAVDVPVLANGNIQMGGDVERCLEATGAAAIMSAEGILYNPLLFNARHDESWKVANEYLDCAEKYEAEPSAIRAHIFRICHHSLLEFADLRTRVSVEHRLEDFRSIVEELRIRTRLLADTEVGRTAVEEAVKLFEAIRSGTKLMNIKDVYGTPHWLSKPYFRLTATARETIVAEGEKTYKEKRKEDLQRKADELGVSLKQARKRERRELIGQKKSSLVKKLKLTPCARCSQPSGQGCCQQMCKKCCRFMCRQMKRDCKAHKMKFMLLIKNVEQSQEDMQQMQINVTAE